MADFNPIENRNFLAPTGFKFVLEKTPAVAFFCQTANIPSLDLGIAVQPTYLKDIDRPGDKLQFGDLSVRFLVDEDLKNYMELQNWMRGLGYPESLDQIRSFGATGNRAMDQRGEERLYSDGTMTIMNSSFVSNFLIKFQGLFPYSLTTLSFDATDTDIEYFTAEASFKYTYYEITDLAGKPL
tara:strand:- start:197 stop:745 length:549 start_codon:yes stop_codon:yes gene_type:complete